MPKKAAKRTLISGGSKNVIVWAGYQKNGMVFLNTKLQSTAQFNWVKILVIGIGVTKANADPLQLVMWVSVIL